MEGHHVYISQSRSEAKDMGITEGISFQRSRVYELLSYAFAEPTKDFLDFVQTGEFLREINAALSAHPCMDKENIRLLESLTKDSARHRTDELVSAYERLTSPELNLLYECNYHLPLNAAEEMADVAGFYRAFGLDFEGDRPDHICMELEFMRLLVMKEAKALMDGNTENAEICISAQKSFLHSHLGRWAGALSRMADGIIVYGEFGKFLSGWIDMECKYLSVMPDEVFYACLGGIDEDSDYCIKEARHEGI